MNKDAQHIPIPGEHHEDLYEVLTAEVSEYENLVNILQSKQQTIIFGDLERLKKMTANEQTQIQRVRQLANKRAAILKQIFLLSGLPKKGISLSEFINHLPEAEQYRWITIRDQGKPLIENIRHINQENQELLKTALEWVRASVQNLFPQEKNAVTTYDKAGAVSAGTKSRKVLNWQV